MLMHEPEPRPRNLGASSPFQRELGFAIEHLSDGDILLFLRHGLGRRIVRARKLGQGHHLESILLALQSMSLRVNVAHSNDDELQPPSW